MKSRTTSWSQRSGLGMVGLRQRGRAPNKGVSLDKLMRLVVGGKGTVHGVDPRSGQWRCRVQCLTVVDVPVILQGQIQRLAEDTGDVAYAVHHGD